MENSFEKYFSESLDFDSLPKDCPAVAAERMRKSYNLRRCYDPLDLKIVLGDITKGISVGNLEKIKKGFYFSLL